MEPVDTGPRGHHVDVVRTIDALPPGLWQRLAPPHDPMWSPAVFTAMERGHLGPEGYAYLVVYENLVYEDSLSEKALSERAGYEEVAGDGRRGGGAGLGDGGRIRPLLRSRPRPRLLDVEPYRDGRVPVAVLPLCLFRSLRLDAVVGPRERRVLAPLRRLAPRLLRVPMLLCGHLLGQGHVLSARPLTAPLARVLVRAVIDFARRERLGTVVLKDFAPEALAPWDAVLREAGFFLAPGLPDTELRLDPDGPPDAGAGAGSLFDAYVASLPPTPRRNARRNMRTHAAHPGLRTETVEDFAHLIPEMLGLYGQVMERADQTLDVIDAAFLHALNADRDNCLVACFHGRRLVAFLLCLFTGEGATGARIGLDYSLAHRARLYHHVHYAAIRLALSRGCRRIRFAQTAYTPKTEMGCALVEQTYALTHVRRLPRAVLRTLLPDALAAARDRALGRSGRGTGPARQTGTTASGPGQEGGKPCPE
ncbi:GNAT family N-acetyltransferase [Streptomyces sp. NPDC007088]|uniref:GNAT family N-acetyltransferase n=1 Tax=Streptomyces sp. NPDC007088 TaxID=3364773 RepID=UPI003679DF76